MDGFKTVWGFLGLVIISIMASSSYGNGISVSCMMMYDEGGVPAVYESNECLQWVLSTASLHNRTDDCQFAQLQGLREYQEDRISCDLHLRIPLPGSLSLFLVWLICQV